MNLGYRYNYTKRLFYFLVITFVCLVLAGLVAGILLNRTGADAARMLRLASIAQDLIAFVLPAMATSVMVSALPATMLGIDKPMRISQLLLAVAVMIASIPAMNVIIEWNAHISLPRWCAPVEEWMRSAETRAAESVALMLSGSGLGVTVVSLLIVGVLAGFSEELFFRGTLQRLIASGPLGIHTSIWLTAVIFSIFHFQFFGFFPRVLLGAWFGYLFYWSGSLWLAVIIHAFNNAIYVLSYKYPVAAIDSIGVGDYALCIGSVIVTAVLISRMARRR